MNSSNLVNSCSEVREIQCENHVISAFILTDILLLSSYFFGVYLFSRDEAEYLSKLADQVRAFIHVCVYICMCVCVCMYICMCVCMYICMCVCVCMYICMCVCVCIYICMCVCVCMYVCMCVCMHVLIYAMCTYLYVFGFVGLS